MAHQQDTQPPQTGEDISTQQGLTDMGASLIKTTQGTIYTLTIVGQIEGHQVLPPSSKSTKYEHVMPLLTTVEESEEIDGLLILLNTVGGDIEAGLALAELISGMKKPTVSLVLGGGHSIGVPISVSTQKTFIAKSATMTIHPVRMNGMVIGVHQSFEHFKKIQDRIIDFVVEHSNITDKQFRSLMLNTGELVSDVGTIVSGEEAVSIGLCDKTGTLSDALACLHQMIETKKDNS